MTEDHDIAGQVETLRLLREEREIARRGFESARADYNRCDTAVKNAEIRFAKLTAALLGDEGTREMVSLTQREWRKRVDSERASKAAADVGGDR